MPIYAYICQKCSHSFDLLEGVTQEKVKKACPECGSENIKKTFAPFGVGKSDFPSSGCSSCPSAGGGSCPMM